MNIKRIGKGSNQVITKEDGTQILFSYSTPVACYIPNKGYYKTAKEFSVTTSKHITQWFQSEAIGGPLSAFTPIVMPQDFFNTLI